MNKKAFSTFAFLVCLFVLSSAALCQPPRRARRSGGLDNLSLPSTGISLPADAWREIAPEGAGFSVMMPGIPDEVSRDQGQGLATLRMYRVKASDMEYLAGVVLNFPRELIRQPRFAETYFDILPSAIAESEEYKDKHYKLTSQSPISINDHPGHQYQLDSPNYTLTTRVYLSERSVYVLVVESPKASVSTDNIEKFLSSFTLKEK